MVLWKCENDVLFFYLSLKEENPKNASYAFKAVEGRFVTQKDKIRP